jgi:HemY protein
MRRFIIFLLFFVASVWIGLKIVVHPGYMLLAYQPWLIEMPLWFALLALVVIFLAFYCLINCIHGMQFFGWRLRNWWHFRDVSKSYSRMQCGLSALIEERWHVAEELLVAGAKQTHEPLINYLGAAKAAHEQRAFDRRDRYIQKAYQADPRSDLVIGLVQAQLELVQDPPERAVKVLTHLRKIAPRHPRVLSLLEKAYTRLADWENLRGLLPKLRQTNLLTAEQLNTFEKNLYCEKLNAATREPLDKVQHIWDEFPRHVKKNPTVVYAYVKQLLRFPGTEKEF